jgi:SH3-like domain-containing protein
MSHEPSVATGRPCRFAGRAAMCAGLVLAVVACSSTQAPPPPAAPPPVITEAPPALPAPPPPPPRATVTGSTLNVRSGPSTRSAVVARVKRGDQLPILGEDGAWLRIRLADGREGWVHSRYVRRTSPCPADKPTAEVIEAPPLSFSDAGGHGTVKIEAEVDATGKVVKTRVVENTAGEAAAAIAENEVAGMRFSPPVRNCKPVRFIYVYTRSF